jgi:O6-methylguanine-DNA--protein-cysteine methyltransferase
VKERALISAEQLSKYLQGQRSKADLSMNLRARTLQLRVWKFLQAIPPIKMMTLT